MSKAKFILGAIALLAIGGTAAGYAYDIAGDECARAPDGTFHWDLLGEGYRHFLDPDAACDPWQVVASDPDVVAITIGFTSGLSVEPSRQVRIAANGDIAVLEPIDDVGMEAREVARGHDPALARELLANLSRFTRYNRVPDKIPDGADVSDPLSFLEAPVIRCTGEVFDGGSVNVQFDLRQRTNQAVMFDPSCDSIAYSKAQAAFHDAHSKAFATAGFKGDVYIRAREGS